MSRGVALATIVAVVLVGCVSVVPAPTTSPQASVPSFGITTPAPATATAFATPVVTLPPIATPTAAPTATAAPIATPEPVDTPTPQPTEQPTLTPTEPAETPPTALNDILFQDTMDDPTSGWSVFEGTRGSAAYADSALRLSILQDASYTYSSRSLGGDFGVALVAAEFTPTGAGSAGLFCLTPSDGSAGSEAYGAIFTQDERVLFQHIDGEGVAEILEENDVSTVLEPDTATVVGLACAGTSTGAIRLSAFGNGTGPLATHQVDEGPESFSSAAAYAEASTAGFVVDASTIAAYGIPGSTIGMTPEGEELLTHVPSDWQSQCIESPASEAEEAVVICFLQQEGDGPELASYEQHPSNEAMDAAYQERVSDYGVESTGSCETGPNETTWDFGDDVVQGNVQCAPQQVGIRFDWTDNRLGILSSLIDFDGDYGLTFAAWEDAGPNV